MYGYVYIVTVVCMYCTIFRTYLSYHIILSSVPPYLRSLSPMGYLSAKGAGQTDLLAALANARETNGRRVFAKKVELEGEGGEKKGKMLVW